MGTPAALRRSFAILLTFVLSVWCVAASAAPKEFAKGDKAWHEGDIEKSRALYEKALKRGGLKPKEVVVAYSRVGTVKAALRDNAGALSDFRVAAAIDPEFELPADSGPAAKKLYAQARDEAASQGQKLTLSVDAPEEVERGERFSVETEIPEGFAVFVDKVVVTISDSMAGKRWRKRLDAEPSLRFDFPGRIATSGARLRVHVAAVDRNNNEWIVKKSRIQVEGRRAGGDDSSDSSTWGSSGDAEDPFADDKKRKKKKKGGGGFFSGPWPWIIGGALLVGGAVTFFATRPGDAVQVGPPVWTN